MHSSVHQRTFFKLSYVLVAQVDGMTIVVEDIVGSTGLELKVDPGVPYVYAGFAGESWCSSVVCQTSVVPRCSRILVTWHVQDWVLSGLHADCLLCTGLMITTLVSYLSHSQVWALQEGSLLHVGGRSNRATVTFALELDDLMNSIPEQRPTGEEQRAAAEIEG